MKIFSKIIFIAILLIQKNLTTIKINLNPPKKNTKTKSKNYPENRPCQSISKTIKSIIF